jgi:transcriptional regulator with XRE-family HTH domain
MNRYINEEFALSDIARRIKRYRIAYPMTQKELAEKSGVSLRSIQYFENGREISLKYFIKILIALDLGENLNVLIPDMDDRPSAYMAQAQGKVRQRASSSSNKNDQGTFKWGDES